MLLLSLKISHPNTLHTPLWSRQHKRPPRVTNESAGSWFLHSAAPNTLAHSWWQALRPRLPHHRWLSKRRTVTRLTSNVGQRHRHKLFTGPAPRTIYYRRELTCARSPTHARICIFINNKQNNKVFLLMCGWSIHACLEINSQPVIASASNMSKRQRGRESERFSGTDERYMCVCLIPRERSSKQILDLCNSACMFWTFRTDDARSAFIHVGGNGENLNCMNIIRRITILIIS